MRPKLIGLLLSAALTTLGGSIAQADVVLYDSHGFEVNNLPALTTFSTAFTNPLDPTVVGNLRGQDAAVDVWREAPADPAASNVGGDGATTGTAVIETPTAPTGGSGSQDVKVTRTTFDDRWAPVVSYTQNSVNPLVKIDWSMNVSHTTPADDPVDFDIGPLFGIEAYQTSTNRIGGVGVDAATGEIYYETGTSLSTTPGDTTVDFGKYHNYEIVLDFNVTGPTAHTYSFSLDGTTLVSGIPFLSTVTGFTDADIAALKDDVNENGTAFFDNYIVTAVPEPTFAALFGIGLVALTRRKRDSIS